MFLPRNLLRNLRLSLREAGWPLSLALLGCVAMALLALTINVVWVGRGEEQLSHIVRTRDRIDRLSDLNERLALAESAQHGYLVEGDPRYLPPYDLAVRQLRSQLAAVEKDLAQDDAGSARLGNAVNALSVALGERIAEMDTTISLARDSDLLQARNVFQANEGRKKGERIRTVLTRMEQSEQRYLERQRTIRRNLVLGLRISLALTTLVVLSCVFLMVRRLLGDVARAQAEQAALAQQQQQLDALVRQRTQDMEKLAVEYQLDVERERRTLARELHDELGAILTATKIDLHWIGKQLGDSLPAVADKLAKTQRNLDHGIQFKRQLVQDLHPSLLTTFGLGAAIRTLAEDSAARGNWQLTLSVPEDLGAINEVQGLIVYRIIQEALHNATKYASAQSVSISLIIDTAYLKLEVADDGIGMNPSQIPDNRYGLTGMRHRVIAVGGSLNVISARGEGVTVCALIPRHIDTAMRTASHPLPL
ncbi:CHASE3 domain-containing protein [Chitinibacteraceae bacterium HSL-7]